MRNFLEFRGQSIRLDLRPRARRVRPQDRAASVRALKPTTEIEVKHNGDGREAAEEHKW